MKLVSVRLGNITATVDESIADKLRRADAAMFGVTGHHLNVSYSYRSTDLQRKLYEARKPGTRVAPPGKSFHEKGLAIDVENWLEASPFLHKEGFRNDLWDDKNHFSIGEFGGSSRNVKLGIAGLLILAGIVYLLIGVK